MDLRPILLAATCVYGVLLAATIYFTRPTTRRLAGALAGGAAIAVTGVGIEVLCHTLGFWRYPSTDAPYGPPLMYPLIVLVGAVLSLIGWRISRRFGWRGQAVFLAALAIVGTARDYRIAAGFFHFIEFAPGIGTVLLDAALWAGLTALAQCVMRLVAGPAGGDALARRSGRESGASSPRPAGTPSPASPSEIAAS
jgi:hypothetical protein